MYPIIYTRSEKNFEHNGLGVLKDIIKCEVKEEDNAMFELEGECTVSSFLANEIEKENIIRAWASEELGEQLFRIYRVKKNIKGLISFYAQHITYDLLDNFIESIEVADVTCENALNEIFKQCAYEVPFKGYSNITHKGSIILQRVNPMQAIKGIRGSICDTYGRGPKVIKDNFDIKVMSSRGRNNNVLVAYKKNMLGFESDDPITDSLTTVIYPYAKITTTGDLDSEETISLPEKYIYSKYYEHYNNLKIKPIDLSGEDVTDVDSLRKKAETYFERTSCDVPNVNYKVEFLKLSDTINYADYKDLENVQMGDTVIVRDYRFNLNIEAKVIKTNHCSITKRLLSCELGSFKYSMSDVINDINKDQADILDKVDKIKIDIDNELGQIQVDIKDDIKGLQTQITANTEGISSKVSNKDFESYKSQTAEEIKQTVKKGDVISSINQTAEEIKITANKISLEGSTTIGTAAGDKVKINNGNYEIINEDNTKAFFGLRKIINEDLDIPRFAIGHEGVDPSKDNYCVMTPYMAGESNPQQYDYPYIDIAYRNALYKDPGEKYNDVSNIRMYADGKMRLSPIDKLEITTNFKDGNYAGKKENIIAKFDSATAAFNGVSTSNGVFVNDAIKSNSECLNADNILDYINIIEKNNMIDDFIIDLTYLKDTKYVFEEENTLYMNNSEMLKLAILEIKKLRNELKAIKYNN